MFPTTQFFNTKTTASRTAFCEHLQKNVKSDYSEYPRVRNVRSYPKARITALTQIRVDSRQAPHRKFFWSIFSQFRRFSVTHEPLKHFEENFDNSKKRLKSLVRSNYLW